MNLSSPRRCVTPNAPWRCPIREIAGTSEPSCEWTIRFGLAETTSRRLSTLRHGYGTSSRDRVSNWCSESTRSCGRPMCSFVAGDHNRNRRFTLTTNARLQHRRGECVVLVVIHDEELAAGTVFPAQASVRADGTRRRVELHDSTHKQLRRHRVGE